MFNIITTLNDIANLLAPSNAPVKGYNKIDSLDKIFDEINGNITRLNFIDAAYGGPGNWTTVNDVLQSIGSLIGSLNPTLNVSGSYLPVASGLSNIGSVIPSAAQFSRVGMVVTVSGGVSGDPTAAGGWAFELSLPIASNFTLAEQLNGSFNCFEADEVPQVILGVVTNNTAKLFGRAVVTSTITGMSYIYQYLVI